MVHVPSPLSPSLGIPPQKRHSVHLPGPTFFLSGARRRRRDPLFFKKMTKKLVFIFLFFLFLNLAFGVVRWVWGRCWGAWCGTGSSRKYGVIF